MAAALLCALPSLGAAQSASEILDNALQRYEQRMAGIDNYTVVQSAEGMGGMASMMGDEGTTLYYEKTMVDGHPVFQVHHPAMDSIMQMQQQSGAMRSPAETMRLMKDHASLEGSDTVDGHDCWVIRVDDPAALAPMEDSESSSAMKLESMTMCLDKEEYVPRRMTMEGEMSVNGQTNTVDMESHMTDYREVDGLLHPFRTEVSMSGMTGSMSPEERENTRKQLEEAKAKMAEMPEAQRAMMEKMMGGRLEQMEQMLAEGSMSFAFVVKDLKVNAGPPAPSGGRDR